MNKDKVSEQPFHYPNTLLLLLGYAKAYFHLPYRQTKEGIAQEDTPKEKYLAFLFTTINRRRNSIIYYKVI